MWRAFREKYTNRFMRQTVTAIRPTLRFLPFVGTLLRPFESPPKTVWDEEELFGDGRYGLKKQNNNWQTKFYEAFLYRLARKLHQNTEQGVFISALGRQKLGHDIHDYYLQCCPGYFAPPRKNRTRLSFGHPSRQLPAPHSLKQLNKTLQSHGSIKEDISIISHYSLCATESWPIASPIPQ